MSSVDEARLDVNELKELIEKATRPRIKDLLEHEVRRLEGDIHRRAASGDIPQTTESSTEKSAAIPQRIRTKIELYGWGQSDKFLTLYISDKLKNLKDFPVENITSEFTERGVHLEIKDLNQRDYFFDIKNLSYPIVPEQSSYKLKSESIVLNLKKKESKEWECVTAAEKAAKDKKKEKFSDSSADMKGDPSASLMNMMKKMYEDGDDETKRMLTKTWYESSQKQNKGMGGMGMGPDPFGGGFE